MGPQNFIGYAGEGGSLPRVMICFAFTAARLAVGGIRMAFPCYRIGISGAYSSANGRGRGGVAAKS